MHHADSLETPVLFVQGGLDEITLPSHTKSMHAALRAKGFPTALLTYPNEGHSSHSEDSQEQALNGELYFFGKLFKFCPIYNMENDGMVATVKIPIDNEEACQTTGHSGKK